LGRQSPRRGVLRVCGCKAATATIYAHRYDAAHDETSGVLGGREESVPETWRFSIDVAKAWERAFNEAPPLPLTRKLLLRSAVILSPDRGGIFDVLLGLVRHRLGGRVGDGRQFVSWIHDADFIRTIYWLITHENLEGVVNLASPNPLPNAEFMCVLREAWGTRVGLPASRWMLEIATFFMRTETELVLKSRRAIPGRLLQNGFEFRFPNWNEAARDLCQRWRSM
jgi:NAD dependent epimerase/dehydratase family enzyme